MSQPAKFAIPRQRSVVARRRLFDLLEDQRDASASWISGSPGAGKTTLVASYLQDHDLPCVWLRLDDADNDLANFFAAWIDATRLSKRRRELVPAYTAEHGSQVAAFARRFFRALFAQVPASTCFVVDDLHELEDGLPLEVLRVAIEEVPFGVRLFLLSRVLPSDVFVGLEASRRLIRFDEDALAFTREEIRALLPHHDERAVSSIDELTGGWSAGIVLAARCWSTDIHDADHAAAHEAEIYSKDAIFGFFAHEILDKLPRGDRRLLEQLAILPEMTRAQAEALTGDARAGPLLEGLYRHNLFTSMRRSAPPVYRLHSLFREFLTGDGRRVLADADLASTRARAVDELLASGHLSDALEILASEQDWMTICAVLEQWAERLLHQGRYGTLHRWGGTVPADVLARHPRLIYWMGQARAQDDGMAACALYERAFAAFQPMDPVASAASRALCAAAAILAIHMAEATYKDIASWGDRLRDALALDEGRFSVDDQLSIDVAIVVCSIFERRVLRDEDAATSVERVIRLMETEPSISAPLLVMAAIVLMHRALTERDEILYGRATAVVEPRLEGNEVTAYKRARYLIVQSIALFVFTLKPHGNRSNRAAREVLAKACALIAREELSTLKFDELVVQSHFAAAEHDHRRQIDLLTRANDVADYSRPFRLMEVSAALCAIHLGRGEIPDAMQAYERGRRAAELAAAPATLLTGLYITFGYALIADGRAEEAASLVGSLRDELRERQRLVVDAFALLARSSVATDPRERLALLDAGMRTAVLGGWTKFFYLLPAFAAGLCERALAHGFEVGFARECIERQGLPPPFDAGETWPWIVRIHVLGPFELTVHGQSSLGDVAKVPRRQVELLQLIASSGPEGIDRRRATDLLWPSETTSQTSLDVTLHRLRKLLGVNGAIVIREGRLCFDAASVWCDAIAFEAWAQATLAPSARAPTDDELESQRVRLLDLYRGPLLPDAPDSAWLVPVRERHRTRFEQVVRVVGGRLEQRRRWASAIRLYERAIEHESLIEEFYRGLMRCHLAMGQRSEALIVYRRCRQLLSIVLGIAPARTTEEIHQRLLHSA